MICPRGTYSDTDTAYSCIKCQSGLTTVQEGSTNSSNCQGSKMIFQKKENIYVLKFVHEKISEILCSDHKISPLKRNFKNT